MFILPLLLGLTCTEVCSPKEGLTIHNNCGSDFKVFRDQSPVPDRCLDGLYCSDFFNDNPAFHVRRAGDRWEQGVTLAELYLPTEGPYWWDISKVAGFNVGVEIKYSGTTLHTVTRCTEVNCEDAFFLCDIAVQNIYYPVYRGEVGGFIDITFCPSGDNSIPLRPPPGGVRRVQESPENGPFTCEVKLWDKNIELDGTVVQGGAILF